MKKVIILILLAILLVGCQNSSFTSIYNDDNKIVSGSNTFSLTNYEQDIDGQRYFGTVNSMDGMDTIWIYEATEDTKIDMRYLLTVQKGKVKLVLISPDKSLTTLVESTNKSDLKDYATNKLFIKKGLNRIKFVADENAKFDFDIIITEGEFQELGL